MAEPDEVNQALEVTGLTSIRTLLDQVEAGQLPAAEAQGRLLQFLRQAQFEDLGYARIDHQRELRVGFPEVVFGQGKTPQQVAAIAERIVGRGHNLLVTRTSHATWQAVDAQVSGTTFHETARAITARRQEPPAGRGTILVIAAGTSDLPVAEEAAITADLLGNSVDRLYDVGVAGLHRLLSEHRRLLQARVVIVVAGMEGALPSVVGGLVAVPLVAVPTSVGYGASFGGMAALLAMLNSCAAGVSVVNIDNGFGAAVMASLINHL